MVVQRFFVSLFVMPMCCRALIRSEVKAGGAEVDPFTLGDGANSAKAWQMELMMGSTLSSFTSPFSPSASPSPPFSSPSSPSTSSTSFSSLLS